MKAKERSSMVTGSGGRKTLWGVTTAAWFLCCYPMIKLTLLPALILWSLWFS